MNTKLTNRLNMIDSVLVFCDNNPAPTVGILPFGVAKTAVENKRVLIEQLSQIVEASIHGVTLDTNILRVTMCEIALKCGDAVSAYAATVGNNTLRERVTFTLSGLNKFKKEEVDGICQNIHDDANANIAAAGQYGYAAGDVTDLQTAIDLYRASFQNPRYAIIGKRDALAQVNLLVREILDELFKKQMDKMVNTLKVSNPNFVNQYYYSREILDLGTTSAKVRGTVTTQYEVPLANVVFTIYETGTTNIVKQVVSDAEGKFSAAKLPVGDFDFKWELDGYVTIHETNVHISAGKELKRNIVMNKAGKNVKLSGDVAAGASVNIPVNSLKVTDNTIVKLVVSGTMLRFYAAKSPVEPIGAQYLQVIPGENIEEGIVEFAQMVGFDEDFEDYLNVNNNTPLSGHWELSFENLGA